MSIFRRAFCFAAFAFSLCAWADPIYFISGTPDGWGYTYSYDPNFIPDLTAFGYPSDAFLTPSFEVYDPSGEYLGDVFIDYPFSGDWELSPTDYIPSNPAYTDPIAPATDPLAGGGGDSPSGGGSGGGSSTGGGGTGGGGDSPSGGGGSPSGGGGGGGGGSPDDGEGGGSPDDGGGVSGGGPGWDAYNPDDPLKSAEEGISTLGIALYSLLGVCAVLVLLFLYWKLTKKSMKKLSASERNYRYRYWSDPHLRGYRGRR